MRLIEYHFLHDITSWRIGGITISSYTSYTSYSVAIQALDMDNNINTIILSTSLIHKVFEYIDDDYKLLIHREGSSDEQRSKILSIELIMRSGLEDYFENVLLCDRWRDELCNEAARRGYVITLMWARKHRCDWNWKTCRVAALAGHLDCLIWAREHGCNWDPVECRQLASTYQYQNILDWMTCLGF